MSSVFAISRACNKSVASSSILAADVVWRGQSSNSDLHILSDVRQLLALAPKMRTLFLFWPLILLVLLVTETSAARGGGRGRIGGRKGQRYGSRMPVLIVHKNPASASYYEHKDGAKITKSSHFELDYMLGRKITFFCMATGVPRPEITWFKDGIELYAHRFFQVHEWPMGNDTMKSKMEIDPTTQKDAGYYECQADNQYAIDRRGFRTDYVIYTY